MAVAESNAVHGALGARPRRGPGRGDRGASLVEFALIVPLLSLFLFGIVQFGIAYDKQQSVNSAAREGARLGALRSSTLADISGRAADAADDAATASEPVVEVYDSNGTLVGRRETDGTYTNVAASTESDPGNPAPEDDDDRMPCGRVTPSDFVRVIVSTPYDITIPFWGVQNVTLDSTAEFRCE